MAITRSIRVGGMPLPVQAPPAVAEGGPEGPAPAPQQPQSLFDALFR